MKPITMHKTAKIRLFVGAVIVGLGLIVATVFLLARQVMAPRVEIDIPKEPTAQTAEMKLLVMGDVFWGRYVNDWSMASPLKYAYPFQRLGDFERDNYDAWIANLECPVTNNPKLSSKQVEATLTFDCSPAYLPEAAKWFSAVSLANNHTDNQGGQAGLIETKQHLDANGIQYFGAYEPEDLDNICNILSLPVRVSMSDGEIKSGKLPIVWCGYHGVFKIPSQQSIDVIKRYTESFNVMAMPHSGREYVATADEIKTRLYYGLIEAGADVVVGGHPHWVQGSEAYRGKLIMYSLGNFIFDQQLPPEMTRSAVLDITLSLKNTAISNIDKWLALGEQCSAYADDCLVQAEAQKLTKLPFDYNFAVLGSTDTGKITRRADESQLVSIKERLDWQRTISGLTERYSGQ